MNIEPLDLAAAFTYMGRTLAYKSSDWDFLYQNLWKARRWWRMLGKVVNKSGATVRVRGMFYKTVVQSVLFYGRDSWVVTGDMIKVLEVFHHWASRRIAGMTERRTTGGDWEWPPVDDALETSGI